MSNEATPSTGVTAGADLAVLQRRIGFQFQSPTLLERALTHKSFSKLNNERLEFIGDAVLGYLVGLMLYRSDDTLAEDAMSLMRANLVRGTSLAELAREIGLHAYLRLGSGELKSGGRQRDSIVADAFEALIGAIHEDGGIQACADAVEALFRPRLVGLDRENLKDAKTKLQELLQGAQMELPDYQVVDVTGEDHRRSYTVACQVMELALTCTASESSRRGAEQSAAVQMLAKLEELEKLKKLKKLAPNDVS